MKVLVATRESQGSRERDVWRSCIEGELVRPIEERCGGRRRAGCSCETAFVGVVSGGLTSTAAVRDLPALRLRDYADALERSLTRRERRWVVVDRYAEELARVAGAMRGDGPIERWDEWTGRRFDEDGELVADIATIAGLDPAALDDLAWGADRALTAPGRGTRRAPCRPRGTGRRSSIRVA